MMSKSIKKTEHIKVSNSKATGSKTKRRTSARKVKKSDVPIHHVIPLGGTGWVVKNSKLPKFTFITDRKSEAIRYARSIARRRGEIVEIHSRDNKTNRENYTRRKRR